MKGAMASGIKSAVVRDGKTVSIGDSVGFKSDVEQSGEIVAIRRGYRRQVELELRGEFIGDYIGGYQVAIVRASECWTE